MTIKVKLLREHEPNCLYITNAAQNPQAWFLNTYDGLKHIKRDAAGGQRGDGYRWVEFICLDTRCKARGIVRVDTIEQAIVEAMRSGVRFSGMATMGTSSGCAHRKASIAALSPRKEVIPTFIKVSRFGDAAL